MQFLKELQQHQHAQTRRWPPGPAICELDLFFRWSEIERQLLSGDICSKLRVNGLVVERQSAPPPGRGRRSGRFQRLARVNKLILKAQLQLKP
jgi:hypothetical protein